MFSRFRRRTPRQPGRSLWRGVLWGLPLIALLGLAAYLVYLDKTIRDQFEGRRWALPAYVYARSLELFPGARLSADALEKELRLLAYQPLQGVLRPGSYQRRGDTLRVFTRPFTYWDGKEPASDVELQFNGGDLAVLTAVNGGRPLDLARLDPVVIGRIYPAHHEDRVLVKLEQVPGLLRDGLQAVEDKHFYHHWGVDPLAVLRALWANLREGEVVQGGSTLT
ncbi:MAG: transglycosylase domain-containing protein, partial [Pseudomonadota bacterium]